MPHTLSFRSIVDVIAVEDGSGIAATHYEGHGVQFQRTSSCFEVGRLLKGRVKG